MLSTAFWADDKKTNRKRHEVEPGYAILEIIIIIIIILFFFFFSLFTNYSPSISKLFQIIFI